jgi:NAD(P)-dependent dehydrogenase (short-subunit alcohol dehydrogenase family)
LTLNLMPLLKNSSKARVITVSSFWHSVGKIHFSNINLRNNAYRPLKAYNQSKLANVLFTRELSRRLGTESSVKTYCLHPGAVGTDLSRHSNPFVLSFRKKIFVSPELGVQTTLYCALEPTLESESGRYYE